ncbi:MAG: hypothetical protein ACE5DY_08330 [Mariprofundaceae bacterium]
MFDGQSLKEKQRTIRDGFPENLGLRVHRAISWLLRSEQETDDPDAAFLFLWIAFNACYGEDSTRSAGSGSSNERQILERYFQKILQFDTDGEIQAAVWERFSGPIRVFLDNQYVFQPFWKFYNGVPGYDNWEQSLNQARKKAVRAIGCGDTLMVLSILFDRL